ncbi:N-acetyltransferase [Pedobacter sp. MC2016-14]|uniref:GNAT family N-acetyltransferase n=1 Tax=Pedobacter sp. MC2016-14 TaxID=2897327 RepID=UPI001E5D3262|nr:GNAT family N-acetyltransferase [Pedobacter sp. MC2016-14]MCD0490658.1 N-acetyltransferase [Pedobacter sp. MC2016-14]
MYCQFSTNEDKESKKLIHLDMNYEDLTVVNNVQAHNFELTVNGKKSFIDYKQKGNKVYLIHTEVPKEQEGQGIAAALVAKTFQYIEENGLKIVPLCTYVAHYLKRHPEWNKIVTA